MAFRDNKPRIINFPRELAFEIKVSESVSAGDCLVYAVEFSGWKRFNSDLSATAAMIALGNGASGEPISVAPAVRISSFSGAPGGGTVYSDNDGGYADTGLIKVGVFLSESEAYIDAGLIAVS